MVGLTGISSLIGKEVDDWAGGGRLISPAPPAVPVGACRRALLLVAVLALVAVVWSPVFGGAACRAGRS